MINEEKNKKKKILEGWSSLQSIKKKKKPYRAGPLCDQCKKKQKK